MTECRFLPMFCCHHPRRIAINPHTKDFGVGVKTCFHCGRHICPKCQWRDSHHTFCGRVCYRKYLLWRQVREAKWFVRRKGQAFYPKNAIAFLGKRNLWPNTASKLAVQILRYLKKYARFCPASFSLSLAQILRLPRKIKTKCIFSVKNHQMANSSFINPLSLSLPIVSIFPSIISFMLARTNAASPATASSSLRP